MSPACLVHCEVSAAMMVSQASEYYALPAMLAATVGSAITGSGSVELHWEHKKRILLRKAIGIGEVYCREK